jgi:hypothetical protein
MPEFESEIERAFWWSWRFVEAFLDPRLGQLDLVCQLQAELEGERYRFDFVVFPRVGHDHDAAQTIVRTGRFVVIEVDGHDFHERTKEQVRARDRRDRAIQRLGAVVCHYSGREVYTSPVECVLDTVKTAEARGLFASPEPHV